MKQSALLTDYYQLSMAYGYWQCGMHNHDAVFHLFFRRNPRQGNYVVASGINAVIDFLNEFHFTDDDIAYLKSLYSNVFSDDFLSYLKTLRFDGDVDGVPEGSVVFPHEPLLRIKAPLLLCQLLETPLINLMNFSSNVSTMASRIRHTVGNDQLGEFGLRRSQGPNGGLTASYAAHIGGFDSTSNVLAGKHFRIPLIGTMAHSWIMAFKNELTAFQEYARLMPNNVVLLVDTYDTLTGVDNAITVGKTLKAQGHSLKGIRLDSGDLSTLAKQARAKLDSAGFHDTKIMVSGDLTEARIQELKLNAAPVEGWGVGTQLVTVYEQPSLDMVYKLGAIQHHGQWQYKLKRSDSSAKTTDPGILQTRRFFKGDQWLRDVIYHCDCGLSSSSTEASQDLLIPLFRHGKLIYTQPTLSESRKYCLQQVKTFHASTCEQYLVEKDEKLVALKQQLLDSLS